MFFITLFVINPLSRRRSAAGAVLSGHWFPPHDCPLPTLATENVVIRVVIVIDKLVCHLSYQLPFIILNAYV